MIRFLEALAILLLVGAIISTFLWLFVHAIGTAADERRDRARSWTRDV